MNNQAIFSGNIRHYKMLLSARSRAENNHEKALAECSLRSIEQVDKFLRTAFDWNGYRIMVPIIFLMSLAFAFIASTDYETGTKMFFGIVSILCFGFGCFAVFEIVQARKVWLGNKQDCYNALHSLDAMHNEGKYREVINRVAGLLGYDLGLIPGVWWGDEAPPSEVYKAHELVKKWAKRLTEVRHLVAAMDAGGEFIVSADSWVLRQ